MISKTLNIFKFWKYPKKIWLILIILLIASGGGYFYQQKNKPTEPIQTIQAKKVDIQASISASGTLVGKETANLKFKISGKLYSLEATKGANVKKGDVIAYLDSTQYQIALQQARNTLRDKQAIVDNVLDQVKDHSKDETFTQKQTRTTAEAARDNAYDEVKAAERDLQDTVIISPINGKVTKIEVVEGQNITTADLIAQIADIEEIYFDAEVDEADIGKVKLGQATEVSLNPYEDKTFQGTVAEIGTITKTTSSGATAVIVRINLGKPVDINFVSGVNGQAKIIYQETKGVLGIPQDAIWEATTVYIKSGNEFKAVQIKTGLQSDTDIEVTEGLSEGMEIVTNPQAVKK